MKERIDDILSKAKLKELLAFKKQEEKKKHRFLLIFAVIGGIAAVAAIAYGVYRFLNPKYDDFDSDFDYDDLEDDFDEISGADDDSVFDSSGV